MNDRYTIFRNQSRGGYYYLQDRITRKQESLGTQDKKVAQKLLNARNEAERQPAINRQIVHAYLRAADPRMITRIWQQVMGAIVAQKQGETHRRWSVAVKDEAFDSIRKRPLIETTPEELLSVVRRGTVSTNVYLRRIHNFALDMDWLIKPTVPKRQWPKVIHRKGKASRRTNTSASSSGSRIRSGVRSINCSGTWEARSRTWHFSMRRMWTGRIGQSRITARNLSIVESIRPRSALVTRWFLF